jgi:hypothetical protein
MAYQYATKVICGLNKEPGRLARGIYETVINIHNPNEKESMPFRYKLAMAATKEDGKISQFREGKIGPDGAQFFGCADLHNIFDTPNGIVIDGFFVIECKGPLDVVAVYTTNDLDGKGVPAIEVERTFERVIP